MKSVNIHFDTKLSTPPLVKNKSVAVRGLVCKTEYIPNLNYLLNSLFYDKQVFQ